MKKYFPFNKVSQVEELFCHSVYCKTDEKIYTIIDAVVSRKHSVVIGLVNDDGREFEKTALELFNDYTFKNHPVGIEVEVDDEEF